jgi:hypothetical protein
MNPANQIAQLRDRLTALENAHALSERYDPSKSLFQFINFGKNVVGNLAKVEIEVVDTARKVRPGTPPPTKKIEVQKIDGKWYKKDAAGEFKQPATYDEINAAETEALKQKKAGAGPGTPGNPTGIPEWLMGDWALDPKNVAKIQTAVEALTAAVKSGTVLLSIYQYNEMIARKNNKDWWGAAGEAILFSGLIGSILAPLKMGTFIAMAIVAFMAWSDRSLDDQDKARLTALAKANLNTPIEELKKKVDGSEWKWFEERWNELKAGGGAAQQGTTPPAQQGTTPPAQQGGGPVVPNTTRQNPTPASGYDPNVWNNL